jgi:hypothetical protein
MALSMQDEASPIVDTVYSMTQPELLRASVMGAFQRLWLLLAVSIFVTPIAFVVLGVTPLTVTLVIVDWLLLPAVLILRPWYALSSPKTKAQLERPTRMVIDPNSVKIFVDDELRGTLKFDEMLKAVRLKEFWLLRSTRTLNYAIPRKIFNSEQETQFVAALKHHKLIA